VSIATDYSRLVSYRLNVQVEWAALIYPIAHARKMLCPRFEERFWRSDASPLAMTAEDVELIEPD
jgi:hypothetical protein